MNHYDTKITCQSSDHDMKILDSLDHNMKILDSSDHSGIFWGVALITVIGFSAEVNRQVTEVRE